MLFPRGLRLHAACRSTAPPVTGGRIHHRGPASVRLPDRPVEPRASAGPASMADSPTLPATAVNVVVRESGDRLQSIRTMPHGLAAGEWFTHSIRRRGGALSETGVSPNEHPDRGHRRVLQQDGRSILEHVSRRNPSSPGRSSLVPRATSGKPVMITDAGARRTCSRHGGADWRHWISTVAVTVVLTAIRLRAFNDAVTRYVTHAHCYVCGEQQK